MINVRERIIEVLNSTHLLSLGTMDENGVWVADLVFTHDDDLNIYWMSHEKCRHSEAIMKNKKVAGSITYSTKSKENNFGIQFEGNAEKLSGIHLNLLIKHLAKRGHPKPNIATAKEIMKKSFWYKVTPTKIQLIDEENLGFKKEDLDTLTISN